MPPLKMTRYVIGATVLAAFVAALWAAQRYVRLVDAQMLRTVPAEPLTLRFFRDPKVVPAFTVAALNGRTISAKSLRGKVTLVNFWATWCPPCRAEIPDLIALQNKYSDRLQILGISEDEGSPDAVRKFVAEFKINYPVAMTTPELEKLFAGVTGLPTTFLLDPEGRIVQKHVGLLNASFTEAETRFLAGLSVNAKVERVDPDKPVGLENAAQAKHIPGIDLATLTSERRGQALQKLNADPCTCGCGLTVAKCRVDDPECSVSLPLARTIVAQIIAAK